MLTFYHTSRHNSAYVGDYFQQQVNPHSVRICGRRTVYVGLNQNLVCACVCMHTHTSALVFVNTLIVDETEGFT